MSNLLKNVGKAVGKGVVNVAYYSTETVAAAISAIWESTGTRGEFRKALEECSDEELIEINLNNKDEDGDFDFYQLSKSLLKERNYRFNTDTNKWEK